MRTDLPTPTAAIDQTRLVWPDAWLLGTQSAFAPAAVRGAAATLTLWLTLVAFTIASLLPAGGVVVCVADDHLVVGMTAGAHECPCGPGAHDEDDGDDHRDVDFEMEDGIKAQAQKALFDLPPQPRDDGLAPPPALPPAPLVWMPPVPERLVRPPGWANNLDPPHLRSVRTIVLLI